MGVALSGVWGLVKGVLFNRHFWMVLAILASLWFAYSWAYDRGASSRDQEVAALKRELAISKGKLDAAHETAKNQKSAYDTAMTLLKAETAVTIAELKNKLDQSVARERKWKESRNVVVKRYITAAGDAGCVVPAGFVRLHNLAAKGLDPPTAAEAASVPGSGSETADSPTSTKLSAIGAVIADNYSECQSRLEVIEGWQMWYTRSLGTWRKAVDLASQYQVVTPLEVPSDIP